MGIHLDISWLRFKIDKLTQGIHKAKTEDEKYKAEDLFVEEMEKHFDTNYYQEFLNRLRKDES